jgi:CubicO group peptidase (beta-lactamase class C family)
VDGYGLGTIDFRGSYLNVDAIGHVGRKPGSRAALMVFPAHGISVAILTPTGTEVEPFVQYLVKAGHLVQD